MKNIVFGLIIILSLISCKQKEKTEVYPETNGENTALSLNEILKNNPTIKIGKLQIKTIEQKIKCTGKVEIPPTSLLSVHSKTQGSISFMKYLPGDFVSKGNLLFRVSHPELISMQRNFLETGEKRWLSEKELERKKTLFDQDAISEKIYDQALSEKNSFFATYRGQKTELAMLGIHVEKLESEKIFQKSVPIYAAESGYVQDVYVNKGQMIRPEDKLMDIANGDHIHLELEVLSKDVPLLEIGQKVIFTLPKNAKELNAEIVKLNPVIDPGSGTLKVHCHIDKDDCQHILPGMFVNAEIIADERDVLGLPTDAVLKESEQYFTFLVKDNQLLKKELSNVAVMEGFLSFDTPESDSMVIAGAYYLE